MDDFDAGNIAIAAFGLFVNLIMVTLAYLSYREHRRVGRGRVQNNGNCKIVLFLS